MRKTDLKNDPYKYLIKEKLDLLPPKEKAKTIEAISKAIKKHRRTFDRYCDIKCSETQDIPAKDLYLIADCLDCSTDDLRNYGLKNDETISTEKPNRNDKV